MKINATAPEGFDAAQAPHRIILEAENDEEIAVLKIVLANLLTPPKTLELQ